MLHTWAEQRLGNATTEDFVALAERVSGQDLATFFKVWLTAAAQPDPTSANGF